MLVASAHNQQTSLLAQSCVGQRLEFPIMLQNLFDLTRELVKSVDDGVSAGGKGDTIFRELDGHHDQCNVLGRVGFGRGDPNLWSRVNVNTTVGLAGDGGSDHVDDSNVERSTFEAVTHGENSIGRLSRLGDKDANVISKDGRLSVEKVRG